MSEPAVPRDDETAPPPVGLWADSADSPGSRDRGRPSSTGGPPDAGDHPTGRASLAWWRPVEDPQGSSAFVERLVVRSAIRIALIALTTVVLALLLWRLRLLVLLLLVALFVAVLLNPAVRALDKRGLSRGSSIGVVYAIVVVTGAAVVYLLVHPVYGSATRFAKELPSLVRQAEVGKGQVGRLAIRLHLLSFVKSHAPKLESLITKLGKPALSVGKTVISGFVGAVTISFVSFFILLEGPKIATGILRWMRPDRSVIARRIVDDMARQVTGFMLGNLATSVIAAVTVYVTLEVVNVQFAGVLAIWVGLVDFLPLVGGLLAGVPAVGVAFLHSVVAGIATVVVFLVYQQLENHVLYPVVISRTVRLNPLWVLLAVIIGAEIGSVVGSTFGALVGALMAVPAAGALQIGARAWFDLRSSKEWMGRPRHE